MIEFEMSVNEEQRLQETISTRSAELIVSRTLNGTSNFTVPWYHGDKGSFK